MPALLLSPWFYLVLTLAAAIGCGKGWIDEKASFDSYKGQVIALGHAAETHAKDTAGLHQSEKENADAENTIAHAFLTDFKRVRDTKPRADFLPAAAASSNSANNACINRADFERAIREFDTGVKALIDTGSAAVIDLNTARQWAQKLSPN